jgi:putative hydrolase of the HAD superfamily
MKKKVTALFVDIGKVLLTDGWNTASRKNAADLFNLDWTEMEDRHQTVSDTHELGKMEFDEYLDHLVFHKKRSFSRARFEKFMFEQSLPIPEMISFIGGLKKKHNLKIIVLSNESRKLNDYRIHKFQLDGFVDSFISSCIVHLRKPDAEIYRLAMDIAHVSPDESVYIDNSPLYVRVAETMGIRSILHTDFQTTAKRLSLWGLES